MSQSKISEIIEILIPQVINIRISENHTQNNIPNSPINSIIISEISEFLSKSPINSTIFSKVS